MPLTLSRKKVLSIAASVSLLVTALAVLSPQGLSEYRRLSNEATRLHEQNGHLRQEIAQKRAEIAALRTSRRFQEKVVREDLGFVRPGEQLIIVETNAPAGGSVAQTGRR